MILGLAAGALVLVATDRARAEAQLLIEASTGRLLFGSPSVDVGNTFRSFFRVTSFFRDPSIYGRHLVLDLSACPFIDSTALACVLRTHSALTADGRAMAVVAGRGEIRKLLYLTAIDQSVPVFAKRGDAVALLGANAAAGSAESPTSTAAPIAGRPSA